MSRFASLLFCFVLAASPSSPAGEEFYLPENQKYTVVHSALDSARFTLASCLEKRPSGHLAARSTFVNAEAEPMEWHDFGVLEGPGWAANAVGGALELYQFAEMLKREEEWRPKALSILDHVLEDGFIDAATGLIAPYRHTKRNDFVLNFKANRDWLCPGSMAKIACQLLQFADALPQGDARIAKLRDAARKNGVWMLQHVKPTENGWYPRRVTHKGETYKKTAEHKPGTPGGDDALWQGSADGLYAVLLLVELTERGLGDYKDEIQPRCAAFVKAGGIFGSINHDTYDKNENVAYAVAFRVLRRAAKLIGDDSLRTFAYEKCLAGLEQFKMRDDRNGVATRGLLWMEKSWDTAYLWECAEAALAYFEAAAENRRDRDKKFAWERDGLTILRAIAKHHHGKKGFLTEGVDWNNHVGEQHHFDGAKFGDIQYTEPFLNNQHIIEPTVFYLRHLAIDDPSKRVLRYRDLEGNIILRVRTEKGEAKEAAGEE